MFWEELFNTTPQDIFIVDFNENAKNNIEVILNESYKEYNNMMERKMTHPSEEFGAEALWNNYLNNKILNNYMSFRRISKWMIQKKSNKIWVGLWPN